MKKLKLHFYRPASPYQIPDLPKGWVLPRNPLEKMRTLPRTDLLNLMMELSFQMDWALAALQIHPGRVQRKDGVRGMYLQTPRRRKI